MSDEKKSEVKTPEVKAEVERLTALADAVPDVQRFDVNMSLTPNGNGTHTIKFETTLPSREALHLAQHIEFALQEFVAEVGGTGVGERTITNRVTGETETKRLDMGDRDDFEDRVAKKIGGNGTVN